MNCGRKLCSELTLVLFCVFGCFGGSKENTKRKNDENADNFK